MALDPTDAQHALQIAAGTTGRKRGHEFETELAEMINTDPNSGATSAKHVLRGLPHTALVSKALTHLGWNQCDRVNAIALGSVTAEGGKKWMTVHGIKVKACKSDILLNLHNGEDLMTVGVSKAVAKPQTQLYFTTAIAFCRLLRNNKIPVSDTAVNALSSFCGDEGFRPLDNPTLMDGRESDPRRFFWKRLMPTVKQNWSRCLITRIK